MKLNKLILSSKGICYDFIINLEVHPNPILEQTQLLYKSLSKSYSYTKKNILYFHINIKYSNSKINEIIYVIKETCKYIEKIKLEINTSNQNSLLNKIIQIDWFDEIILDKKFFSMFSFNEMTNVKTVKYLNHYYSNIKLLPKNLELFEIDIKNDSNIFIELPENIKCIKYFDLDSFTPNIQFDNYDIKSILFVNSCESILEQNNLSKTEYLVLNINNPFIDFTNLSNQTKIIYFCQNYKITNELDYLPNSIIELNLACDYRMCNLSNLSSSVKKINFLTFEDIKNLKLFPIIPNHIEIVTYYFEPKYMDISNIELPNFENKTNSKIKQIKIIIKNGICNNKEHFLESLHKYNNNFDLVVENIWD